MSKELLIKQLLYRSTHRGCKETDILLGKFFTEKYLEFSEMDLDLYGEFIDEDDLLIYDWILGKVELPQKYLDIAAKVRAFHGIGDVE